MAATPDAAFERRPTTRRTLLGAALGAVVAAVATALGRPAPARALDGQPIVIGVRQSATGETALSNFATDATVLDVDSSAGVAIAGNGGKFGVIGGSGPGTGVYGFADGGAGVDGQSNKGSGVTGFSINGRGVAGSSFKDHGLFGHTDAIHGKAGVFGESNDPTAHGVVGINIATETMGVLGTETSGVRGQVPNTAGLIGVHAFALEEATALSVEGTARFSRSGKASLPRGRSYVDVRVPGGLSASSLVLAVPMINRAGVHVQSAVPNAATGKVRINLNRVASSSSPTPIAWFVVN